MEGSNIHNTGFKNYYNYIRPHQGLKGKTPAQVSGLNIKPEWSKILEEALKQPPKINMPYKE